MCGDEPVAVFRVKLELKTIEIEFEIGLIFTFSVPPLIFNYINKIQRVITTTLACKEYNKPKE